MSNQNNDSLVCEQNGCLQEKQSVRKEHFQIEVDAAEDKGSRLTWRMHGFCFLMQAWNFQGN